MAASTLGSGTMFLSVIVMRRDAKVRLKWQLVILDGKLLARCFESLLKHLVPRSSRENGHEQDGVSKI